jgi:hypothetical protein
VALRRPKRLKPGERVLLLMTVAQVELMLEHIGISENLVAVLYSSRVYDNVVRVRCTLDNLGQLAGYVAAEAKNTKDKKLRQECDAILEAIVAVEQSYYGARLRIVKNVSDISSS